jgi:hypothetical protein
MIRPRPGVWWGSGPSDDAEIAAAGGLNLAPLHPGAVGSGSRERNPRGDTAHGDTPMDPRKDSP